MARMPLQEHRSTLVIQTASTYRFTPTQIFVLSPAHHRLYTN